jgi:hypothetical protein
MEEQKMLKREGVDECEKNSECPARVSPAETPALLPSSEVSL